MSNKKFLPVKNNSIFRMFFADERNQDLLVSFLKSVLKLPDEDYNEIVIIDPHLLPEYEGDKLGIIDVKLRTKNGRIIHIEIQLQVTLEMNNRIIFYDAKLITEQLGTGDNYNKINQVISIIITKENLIKNSDETTIPRYHHRFTFYDPDAKIELSDIIEIHTLELLKLPEGTDGTLLYDWAKFIDAENEEEMKMVAERNPEVKKAVVRYEVLTGDEREKYIADLKEKARRDQESRERYVREQGQNQVLELLTEKLTPEEIQEIKSRLTQTKNS